MTDLQWKRLNVGGIEYLLRKVCKAKIYKVVLTDLKRVWVSETEEDELSSSCHNLNPLFECGSGLLVQRAFDALDIAATQNLQVGGEQAIHQLDLLLEDEDIVLKLKTRLEGGLPFKFELCLHHQNEEIFFKEVTRTFLVVIEELVARQHLLCDLLKRKDNEIAEYQLEGARINRRNVETQEFSKDDFLGKCHNTQTSLVSNGTLEVLGVVLKSNLSVKLEATPNNSCSPVKTDSKHDNPQIDLSVSQPPLSTDVKEESISKPPIKKSVKKPSKKIKLNL